MAAVRTRVGFLFPPKKLAKFESVFNEATNEEIEFIKIDINSCCSFPSVDIIVHKLTNAFHGSLDENEQRALEQLRTLMQAPNPPLLIDPLENVEICLNRFDIDHLILRFCEKFEQEREKNAELLPFRVPRSIKVRLPSTRDEIRRKMQDCGMDFPVLVKSMESCGKLERAAIFQPTPMIFFSNCNSLPNQKKKTAYYHLVFMKLSQ